MLTKNCMNKDDVFLHLTEVIQALSLAKSHEEVFSIISHAARSLTQAQGAAFILRDQDNQCYYTDEDSISPLWKGQRFPMHYCISGWVMRHKEAAVIPDIYADPRIPADAYVKTYIKSLVMMPIRPNDPLGTIGTYWAHKHQASEQELKILTALANSTAVALENLNLVSNLREANTVLSNSLKAKDEFISLASHALRTPMTALKLQLQLAQKQNAASCSEDEKKDIYHKAYHSSLKHLNSLTELVEDLIDVSLIRLDLLELEAMDFDLSELTSHIVEKYTPPFRKNGSALTMDVAEKIIAHGDKKRMGQIISHLLENSLKHAKGHDAMISIRKNEQKISIVVEDKGPGIPEEIQNKIFNRFERNPDYKEKNGLGLGLYIVKKLVEAHHGNLFLTSEEGQGTKFIIELPVMMG